MPRLDDIDSLLLDARPKLKEIERGYHSSLESKNIDPKLKIQIKNYLENLRSILDYLGKEVNERYCKRKTRAYFPMGFDSPTKFKKFMDNLYPGLAASNIELFNIIESFQRYTEGSPNTLSLFSTLVNENKHAILSHQTRKETKRITVSRPNGGSVSWSPDNVRFGRGVYIVGAPINPSTQRIVPTDGVNEKLELWISFHFEAISREVLSFLREILTLVESITTTLKANL